MKKVKYLVLGIFAGILGLGSVNAAGLTHSIDLNTTKETGTDNIHIEVLVKNSTVEGAGLKDGKVYVYLDENIVESVQGPTGVYRDYDEATGEFSESNVLCSYDGVNHRVICSFGRTESDLNFVNYSDSKDELSIAFDATLCEGSTNCDIKVEVFGAKTYSVSGSDGEMIDGVTGGYDKSSSTQATKNFDCNASLTNPETPNNPTTPENPENNYEPEENPNTIDNGVVYMLLGTLSLVLIATIIVVNKKKKLA